MKIIYMILILTVMVLFLLIKKSNNKQSLLKWITLTIVMLLVYNIFSCYILTLLNLKSSIENLSVINIIMIIIMAFKLYKDKENQKYFIDKKEMLFSAILLLFIFMIGYKQYGLPMQIKYQTTDPGVHYEASKQFAKQEQLLSKDTSNTFYEFKTMMPGAYVNIGLLFNAFSDVISESHYYYLYIIFDLIILFLIGETFFFTIYKKGSKLNNFIIASVISFIFICAYPLNSMLFGFAYLSVGILMLTALLCVAPEIKKNDISKVFVGLILFLINLGIFLSYYYFVPVAYAALGIYILIDIIKKRKKEKIFSKENILFITSTLILPTIIGFCYCVLPGFFMNNGTDVSHINAEGAIHRDLYSNVLLVLPFFIYYIVDTIKNKKNEFSVIFGVLISIFAIGMFLLAAKGISSTYYFFKVYYGLWIVMMYMLYKSFEKFNEKGMTSFSNIVIVLYIAIICGACFDIDGRISKNNGLFNTASNRTVAVTDIFYTNYTFLNMDNRILTNKQVEAIEYCNNNLEDKQEEILVNGNMLQRIWVYVMTDELTDAKVLNDIYKEPNPSIEEWLNTDKKYYYIINMISVPDFNADNNKYNVIFNNGESIILEK